MRVVALGAVAVLLTGCSAPPVPAPASGSAVSFGPAKAQPPYARAPAPQVKVPRRGSGRYAVVGGRAAPRRGGGPLVRYLVEVEKGLPFDGEEFAADVHATLNDPRGWGRFLRVDHGPARLSVALTSPFTTDRECWPLRTGGELSCWNGRRSVINARRWARGVAQYRGDLEGYRHYLVNHEVGHGLGHHHVGCPGRGMPAPVMVQQSKSLERCLPNPWPFPASGSGASGRSRR
ncbi:DUF3152 domain-containing protein [Nonomuraea dietziae]|uniref:DUF3152 domain-containing protein n=1 Tax=Nonomuraea dietziae TaxID=65515 RepID=UPI0034460FA1